jgi:Tol biopolymer transport system component
VGSFLQRWRGRLAAAAIVASLAAGATAALASSSPPHAPLMTYVTGLAGSTPQVWVALADGSSALDLGAGSSALISPDGSTVAVVSIEKGQTAKGSTLSLYATSGGESAVAARNPQFMQLLAWSPDSKLILVAVGTGPTQLEVLSVAGGHSHTIASGVIEGASFSPGTSEQVVYARAALNKTAVNIYVTSATGAGTRQLTRDGRSEDPLWGPGMIVYSHEKPRNKNPYPELQLWIMKANGSGARQLTNVAVPASAEGLTPVGFSGTGKHLLANLVGPPGSNETEAYTIDLSARKPAARDLTGESNGNIGEAISADGKWILATKGRADDLAALSIELIPWATGKGTTIVSQGAYASWNR